MALLIHSRAENEINRQRSPSIYTETRSSTSLLFKLILYRAIKEDLEYSTENPLIAVLFKFFYTVALSLCLLFYRKHGTRALCTIVILVRLLAPAFSSDHF